INTGTEILLGNILNTHLQFLARELFPLGLRIERQATVPDGDAIRQALTEAFARAEIVLVTGGLGPTTDDITREITAELLGLELVHDPAVMQAIEERFARRNIKITERVRRQAQVPKGAAVLPNPNGTAPGLYFDPKCFPQGTVAKHLFLLPGPPRELQPMFNDHVAPVLKGILPAGEIPECRTYRVAGLGESNVEALVGERLLAIDGLELGYCARPGEVDVRVIGSKAAIERAEEIILPALKRHIASTDNSSLEQVVVHLLASRKETVATAESCTGGFLAHRITNVPGASDVFREGFVTYANEAKSRALKIDPELIAAHGAVSVEVATAMAEHARTTAGVDHALSTTGIAGPDGGSEEKPVGTVFIALASKGAATIVQKHTFPTDRENFKWLVTQTALDLLRRQLA
ncbi:MAG TPA: competence/damage-inducible protein A, partial [Chthoniobacteraceae bacterium]|nr:competence/damage-inducible protein A [Chthoniobacteraceae bacterium]